MTLFMDIMRLIGMGVLLFLVIAVIVEYME